MPRPRPSFAAVGVLAALVVPSLAACGGGSSGDESSTPTVVVSTSILADVVANVAGDQVEIVTLVPAGAAPHDFQPSARDLDQLRQADALVVNGGGLEEGLEDPLDAARDDGVPTHAALDAVAAVEEGDDPHFFTDPLLVAEAAEGIATFLGDTLDLDRTSLGATTEEYVGELVALDAEIEETLAPIPPERRVLVTDHEVFGYFAERYDLEVVGTVIPGGSSAGSAGAGGLAALVQIIEQRDVPAVFVGTSSSDELARTLAEEAGDVEVVPLFAESLGGDGSGGETYIGMMRTNAERIAGALA